MGLGLMQWVRYYGACTRSEGVEVAMGISFFMYIGELGVGWLQNGFNDLPNSGFPVPLQYSPISNLFAIDLRYRRKQANKQARK